MDRVDYDSKVLALLSDSHTYKLNSIPSQSLERRMNDFLMKLIRKGSIHDSLYRKLRSSV